ncbi:UNKNOWN [Stylonychia lemnae]|uniref:BART domain-containing protein n=1 Tax=Stylonychia lemnae TaxID=5949 RepID=A0A078AB68_STYLE|nr:UNKNOWN [Stylonychia lemnae]|eukprot:CDW78852.1 UNKNOWN [Stylonychia lemnae]
MEESKLQEVMGRIEDFYFSDEEDSGEAIFNRFAEKHAHLFEAGFEAKATENKLDLRAKLILELIKDSGVSVEQFFEILKQKSETDEEAQIFVQIMLSVSEYENFVEMMRAYKKEHNK